MNGMTSSSVTQAWDRIKMPWVTGLSALMLAGAGALAISVWPANEAGQSSTPGLSAAATSLQVTTEPATIVYLVDSGEAQERLIVDPITQADFLRMYDKELNVLVAESPDAGQNIADFL